VAMPTVNTGTPVTMKFHKELMDIQFDCFLSNG
jgi:hypothetical protein